MVNRLVAEHVAFEYSNGVAALAGASLELARGELVAVIGPNGSGKSTFLRCLAGLLVPKSGTVVVDGEEVVALPPRERACRLAVVPQFLPRLPDVRVQDFVLGGRYAHLGRWRSAKPHDRAVVRAALSSCDAGDVESRLMSELSGGQRQRVLVARAIAQEAGVLLVDEPTNSLDPEHQLAVFRSIAELVAGGRSALVVTHDLNLASQFASRAIVMQAGRTITEGPVDRVLTREVLEPVYGPHLFFGRFANGRPIVVPWADAR
ncbi:MAG: ABC transporter ATP-binding protein [Planctomycetes bacterium]|nr:ABC transporter ATP-binding protein [Planctomycetota bacterium]